MNTITDIKPTTTHDFLDDVLAGLSQPQKTIPCKWFYDEAGSVIFEEITETPEYYPTRVETKLLVDVAQDLPSYLPHLKVIVEPGSGSSIKTRILLGSQKELNTYIPMEISAEFLSFVAEQLHADYLSINTLPIVSDFTNIHTPLNDRIDPSRLVFFPGSTIGNFPPEEAADLLNSFHLLAGKQGHLLIGVDGTQDEAQLVAAYNDAAGVTEAFNKNLLVRANNELGADFNLAQFAHVARFNQQESRIEMHLKSLCAQKVTIKKHVFNFRKNETIFTENCYKYDKNRFMAMANQCGWDLVTTWKDQHLSNFQLFLLKPSN